MHKLAMSLMQLKQTFRVLGQNSIYVSVSPKSDRRTKKQTTWSIITDVNLMSLIFLNQEWKMLWP